MSSAEESQEVLEVGVDPTPGWWILLVAGIAWVVIALIVLRFNQASITTVGVLVGFVLIGQGLNDLLAASMTPWRWLNIALAVLFIGAGLLALFYPGKTFLALAEIVGFVLVLRGGLARRRVAVPSRDERSVVDAAGGRDLADAARLLGRRPVLRGAGLPHPGVGRAERADPGIPGDHRRLPGAEREARAFLRPLTGQRRGVDHRSIALRITPSG